MDLKLDDAADTHEWAGFKEIGHRRHAAEVLERLYKWLGNYISAAGAADQDDDDDEVESPAEDPVLLITSKLPHRFLKYHLNVNPSIFVF